MCTSVAVSEVKQCFRLHNVWYTYTVQLAVPAGQFEECLLCDQQLLATAVHLYSRCRWCLRCQILYAGSAQSSASSIRYSSTQSKHE
jgi:hypothetical protein